MLLTFDEWMKIWLDSGHWDERGCQDGQFVMSRIGDVGNYEMGNVFIQTMNENVAERHRKLQPLQST